MQTLTAQVLTLSSSLAKENLEISRLKIAAAASRSPPNAVNPPNWDPVGYCWLHGFKVKVGHISTTCTTKKLGYNVDATRIDTKDGGNYNKGWMP